MHDKIISEWKLHAKWIPILLHCEPQNNCSLVSLIVGGNTMVFVVGDKCDYHDRYRCVTDCRNSNGKINFIFFFLQKFIFVSMNCNDEIDNSNDVPSFNNSLLLFEWILISIFARLMIMKNGFPIERCCLVKVQGQCDLVVVVVFRRLLLQMDIKWSDSFGRLVLFLREVGLGGWLLLFSLMDRRHDPRSI